MIYQFTKNICEGMVALLAIKKFPLLKKKKKIVGLNMLAKLDGKIIYSFCRMRDIGKIRLVLNFLIRQEVVLDIFAYIVMVGGYCRINCLKDIKKYPFYLMT